MKAPIAILIFCLLAACGGKPSEPTASEPTVSEPAVAEPVGSEVVNKNRLVGVWTAEVEGQRYQINLMENGQASETIFGQTVEWELWPVDQDHPLPRLSISGSSALDIVSVSDTDLMLKRYDRKFILNKSGGAGEIGRLTKFRLAFSDPNTVIITYPLIIYPSNEISHGLIEEIVSDVDLVRHAKLAGKLGSQFLGVLHSDDVKRDDVEHLYAVTFDSKSIIQLLELHNWDGFCMTTYETDSTSTPRIILDISCEGDEESVIKTFTLDPDGKIVEVNGTP